jgi:hypothetical protein
MTEESEDSVFLTDEEFWHMLRVLTTVSGCLHDAEKRR